MQETKPKKGAAWAIPYKDDGPEARAVLLAIQRGHVKGKEGRSMLQQARVNDAQKQKGAEQ